jgi:hypothetical protein
MQLVFIYGAPAVGKFTVAEELARLTGFRLFHNHLTVDLVSSLFPFGSDPFVSLREEIWLSAFREAGRHGISLIFTFNPERTVRAQFIEQTVETIELAGGQISFIELTCDEAELERRIVNPSRTEFGKLCSLEQYRALKAGGAFNYRSLSRGLSLDTTHTSPLETAVLIRNYLQQKSSGGDP